MSKTSSLMMRHSSRVTTVDWQQTACSFMLTRDRNPSTGARCLLMCTDEVKSRQVTRRRSKDCCWRAGAKKSKMLRRLRDHKTQLQLFGLSLGLAALKRHRSCTVSTPQVPLVPRLIAATAWTSVSADNRTNIFGSWHESVAGAKQDRNVCWTGRSVLGIDLEDPQGRSLLAVSWTTALGSSAITALRAVLALKPWNHEIDRVHSRSHETSVSAKPHGDDLTGLLSRAG